VIDFLLVKEFHILFDRFLLHLNPAYDLDE